MQDLTKLSNEPARTAPNAKAQRALTLNITILAALAFLCGWTTREYTQVATDTKQAHAAAEEREQEARERDRVITHLLNSCLQNDSRRQSVIYTPLVRQLEYQYRSQ